MATKEKYKFLTAKQQITITRNGIWIKKTAILDKDYQKGTEIITQAFIGKTELKEYLNQIVEKNK